MKPAKVMKLLVEDANVYANSEYNEPWVGLKWNIVICTSGFMLITEPT